MSSRDQRIEDGRRLAEKWSDPERRELMRPVALDQASRHQDANRLLFEGLMHHYLECQCSGRMDLWAKAGHAAIDLMASDRVPFVKRDNLYSRS